jgi:hypothetical protein
MIKIILNTVGRFVVLLVIITIVYGFFFPQKALAAVISQDGFENGLGQWQISGQGVTTTLDTSDPVRNYELKVAYPGNNADIVISQNISSTLSLTNNVIYEILFWDDPQRNYGTGFTLSDQSGQYLMIGVNDSYFPGQYFLRNGGTVFNTNIHRSLGWHTFQIYNTEVGSYGAIDGQSLVYLRGQTYPSETPTSFPINTNLKHPVKVTIEYPSWGKSPSLGYWDDYKAYQFRPTPKTTSQMEETLIGEYLASYEPNLTSTTFQQASQNLKSNQNFQLSRLALAAAYGVRYKQSNNINDLNTLRTYLTNVVNDYWGGWSTQTNEIQISGQALAVIASWQWPNLDTQLQSNIKKVLDDIGNISNSVCIGKMANTYNPDGTLNDSKGEEFAWYASFLKFVADVYHNPVTTACGSNDPNTANWNFRAADFACASTTHADPNNITKVASSDNVCTNVMPPNPALTANYIMVNHNLDHPGYALTIAWGLAQAQLYQLNNGIIGDQLDVNYHRNFGAFYTNNIANYIRFSNYTYKALQLPKDNILAFTGRDDWGQDATLQDQAWAYFDKVLANRPGLNYTNTLDPVVKYAWLTRAGKTIYPPLVDANLPPWVQSPGQIPCGPTTCTAYTPNSSLFFFLNSMDAIDRFETLFIINPNEYKLNLMKNQATSTPSLNPGDANGDGKVDETDYSLWLANFSKTGSNVVGDFNRDGVVDLVDYSIWLTNYGK